VIISRKNVMGWECSTYGDRIGACRVLVGKPHGRKQLEEPRLRWEDGIKIYLQAFGWGHGLE
jgi:hypothetical protein